MAAGHRLPPRHRWARKPRNWAGQSNSRSAGLTPAGARRRPAAALTALLVLLTAGMVMLPHASGLHTSHDGIGGVVHRATVPLSTRVEPEQHALQADAALVATVVAGLGLLFWAGGVRRARLSLTTLVTQRGRGPPGRS